MDPGGSPPGLKRSTILNGSAQTLPYYPYDSTDQAASFCGNRRHEPERWNSPSSTTKQSAEPSYLNLPAPSGLSNLRYRHDADDRNISQGKATGQHSDRQDDECGNSRKDHDRSRKLRMGGIIRRFAPHLRSFGRTASALTDLTAGFAI